MKGFLIAVLSILCIPISVTAHDEGYDARKAKFTQHYHDSLFKVAEKGEYSVEVVHKEKSFKVGTNSIDVIIHDKRDRDVTGATIEVVPWMADDGHGVDAKTVVTEKGGGLYRVDNVLLPAEGLWQLKVTVKKGGTEDRAVFEVALGAGDKKHEHGAPVTRPVKLDVSTTQMSKSKSFRITYETAQSVPLNTIHTWKLRVERTDGSAVTGAEVLTDGTMPEHGHGLPTKPRMTQELGSGVYLIEGMKFNMPGWWTVTFTVIAGGQRDSATFNIDLK